MKSNMTRFTLAGHQITVETVISDTKHQWQMRYDEGAKISPWCRGYEGILTLNTPIGLVGYATDYWAGVLPVEIPFLIIKATAEVFKSR